MTRRSDRLDRIEASLARVEGALGTIADALNPGTPGGVAAVAADAKGARSSAEVTAEVIRGVADGLRSSLADVDTAMKRLAASVAESLQRDTRTPAPRTPAPATPMTPVAKAPKR